MGRVSRVCFAFLIGCLGLASIDSAESFAQDESKSKAKRKEENRAKKDALAKDEGKNDLDRVVVAFDPGSHTRPISAMGFSKDQSKLVTVSWDYSIQVWSTLTGERLDILRLPAYGRDNGYDKDRWNVAAVSADGNYVAIGGEPKKLWDEVQIITRLVLVDVANKRVRKYILPLGGNAPIVALAFSADGNRLAIATGGDNRTVQIVDDIHHFLRVSPDTRRLSRPKTIAAKWDTPPHKLALTPTGDRLVAGVLLGPVRAWDVSGTVPENWKPLAEFTGLGRTDEVALSPDGTQIARAWNAGDGGDKRGIEIRSETGELLKRWTFLELAPGFERQNTVVTFRYLDSDRLFVSAHGQVNRGEGYGSVGAVLNSKTGKTVRQFSESSDGMFRPIGTASRAGPLAATTVRLGLEAVVYSLDDGRIVARCGSRTPLPGIVGWSNDPKSPAFAWSDDTRNVTAAKPGDLQFAFDLVRMQPIEKLSADRFHLRATAVGDWKLETSAIANNFDDVTLVNEQTAYRKKFPGGQSVTLIPRGTDPPVYAFGRYDDETMMGSFATIIDTDGLRVANLLPAATRHRDMVASPDGRYLLASTGTHRLSIYKTDGSRFPFMNFVQMNGEWILWTPEGYYTASPSGERLIGWAVTNGANELVRYYPVERFAKHFRRPDLMKLAFEKGSVKLALESLGATAAGFDLPLPPTASLALVEQRDGKAVVKANARSGAKDQPLTAMHLLLDGRPLPAGRGVWKAAPGEVANETFEFDVPAGTHELKLYVRAGDVATLSEALTLKGPRTAVNRTTLHRLCIGIDNYDDRTIPRIGNAAKDAKAIHEALAAECVGESNRFGATAGELLLDKAATRDRILKSLDDARRLVKPGDLMTIYFAGHGWKLDKDYYLLTSDAGPNGKLDGRSLSGADLRKALKDFNCPVLLLLDARHAATGGSPVRSAIDDLTRELCDETVGVTVLSAAMAHETPALSADNGGFARGLLKGLKAGKDVPFDPYERVLYANHLHMATFSEVRRETKGQQNPFLHSPWTATPIALRHVP